jgi:hypothetical protein
MSSQQASIAKHPLSTSGGSPTGHTVALTTLTALFAVRIVAQAMQRQLPLPFLPPFCAFQGSTLPYAILLPAQIVVVAIMLAVVWRVHIGALEPRPHLSRWLTVAGAIYVAAMLTRLGVGLTVPIAPAWFRAAIPTAFHFVLAIFVLVLAAYHRQPRRTTQGAPQ